MVIEPGHVVQNVQKDGGRDNHKQVATDTTPITVIQIRCRCCGTLFSIDEWQRNNCCCSSCDVTRFERRQCPRCRAIFRVERDSKDLYCPACFDVAVAEGLVKRPRKVETAKGVKECIVCGTPFPYVRSNALYCSERCRKARETRRRKERYTAIVNQICQTIQCSRP